MLNIATLTTFFGWCTVINVAVLCLSTLILLGFQNQILALHQRLFGLSEAQLKDIYLRFLGQYKLIIWVLNLTPYIALKIIGQ